MGNWLVLYLSNAVKTTVFILVAFYELKSSIFYCKFNDKWPCTIFSMLFIIKDMNSVRQEHEYDTQRKIWPSISTGKLPQGIGI